jgi:iron complex transport system substrate-binding protein
MLALLPKPVPALLGLFLVGAPLATAQPSRIVAAGGVLTETVHALGEGPRLVGIDSTSLHPADAQQRLPNIGYVRALSAEGILSLKPDLVLAIEGAGPPDVMALIRQAGIPVRILSEEPSEAGVLARIRAVGEIVGQPEKAEALARQIAGDFGRLERDRAQITQRKRVLFVLSMQNGRVMVAGRNSSAAAMIALAGGINAVETLEGFKPLSDEGIIAAAPDVIVMMQRGDHAVAAADLFAHPAFRLTPAASGQHLVTMDGLLLLGFGPRTAEAARELMSRLYSPSFRPRAEAGPRP